VRGEGSLLYLCPFSLFPDSNQVRLLGLDKATDAAIWDYTRVDDFILVAGRRVCWFAPTDVGGYERAVPRANAKTGEERGVHAASRCDCIHA